MKPLLHHQSILLLPYQRRLITHYIPFTSARKTYLEAQREFFFKRNRQEVREIYREILKRTARAMPRKLEREAKLAEFQYMFRACQYETDIDQINEIKQVMYVIIDRLEKGIYPPFYNEP